MGTTPRTGDEAAKLDGDSTRERMRKHGIIGNRSSKSKNRANVKVERLNPISVANGKFNCVLIMLVLKIERDCFRFSFEHLELPKHFRRYTILGKR
jgi:hypothetical protein